ncbi:hypothetical protein E4N78_03020 [Treponema denticola]|nr:hypothetical protein E4N78_03020 [Treponema denticola]
MSVLNNSNAVFSTVFFCSIKNLPFLNQKANKTNSILLGKGEEFVQQYFLPFQSRRKVETLHNNPQVCRIPKRGRQQFLTLYSNPNRELLYHIPRELTEKFFLFCGFHNLQKTYHTSHVLL